MYKSIYKNRKNIIKKAYILFSATNPLTITLLLRFNITLCVIS